MKLTKIISIILILSLLMCGSTWAAASATMGSKWYRIGIATSQSTLDTSKSALKHVNDRLKARVCTLSPRDNINSRIQSTSNSNPFVKQQVC